MEYTATRSIFKFEADGVKFTVTFLTPITPDDYLRQSESRGGLMRVTETLELHDC